MSERSSERHLSPRDFFVDFFGSLVPGTVFLLLLAPSIVIPAYGVWQAEKLGSTDATPPIWQPFLQFRFDVFVGLLFVGYVAGFLFFRQDPKVVDRQSFLLTQRGSTDGPARFTAAEQAKYGIDQQDLDLAFGRWWHRLWFRTKLAFNRPKRTSWRNFQRNYTVEFPYVYLKEYLKVRGFERLAAMITWDPDHPTPRSKHFINLLKARLQFYFPERYGQIARNEAHVRLMSSSWFMCRTVRMIAYSGIALILGWLAIKVASSNDAFADIMANDVDVRRTIWVLAFPLAVIVAVTWTKRQIEAVVHYQRVREVLFVLETFRAALHEKRTLSYDLPGLGDDELRADDANDAAPDPNPAPAQ